MDNLKITVEGSLENLAEFLKFSLQNQNNNKQKEDNLNYTRGRRYTVRKKLCPICNRQIAINQIKKHTKGAEHLNNLEFQENENRT